MAALVCIVTLGLLVVSAGIKQRQFSRFWHCRGRRGGRRTREGAGRRLVMPGNFGPSLFAAATYQATDDPPTR
jgi:hypothetical protein